MEPGILDLILNGHVIMNPPKSWGPIITEEERDHLHWGENRCVAH